MRFQSLRSRISHVLVCACVFWFADAQSAAQWEIKSTNDDVRVLARKSLTGYYEIKAETQVKADILALPRLLDDIERGPEWIDHCEEIHILAAPNDNVRNVQTRFFAPWPVNDRDMVTQSFTQISADGVRLDIWVSDASYRYPPRSETVRISAVRGHWQVIRQPDSTVTITYQGYAEPGGNLPIWLANRLAVSSTMNTFDGLRALIVESKYQTEHASEITD